MINKKLVLTFILIILTLSNFSFSEEVEEDTSYWETIKEKFEELKSDNLDRSEKARSWLEEDIKKIGDWEYKVVEMSSSKIEEIEERLNELGDEKWECFWVEGREKSIVFYFKKTKVSYLQKLPKGDLLKIIYPKQPE